VREAHPLGFARSESGVHVTHPPLPEPWLRGPVPGIIPDLHPVAHALIASREDVARGVAGLSQGLLWERPGGAASVGFHLMHLSGATDRLLTYARGEVLSDDQKRALIAERNTPEPAPDLDHLLRRWDEVVETSLGQLARTTVLELNAPREVGRAKLPSSVRGLLFHAAEHAQRHTGQVITTAKILLGR
jgi:uncharacterized damage-inducible protein DinB